MDIFLIFAQNIHCVEAVLPSTNNLRFGAKIRKSRYTPAYSSFTFLKVGFKGVYISWTCFPDAFCVR